MGTAADKQTKGNPHKQKHTDIDRHRYRATNTTDTKQKHRIKCRKVKNVIRRGNLIKICDISEGSTKSIAL